MADFSDSLQKLEKAELDTLPRTKNLLRKAIFNTSCITDLFPKRHFNEKSAPALDMEKILKLNPMMDADTRRRLIDWMEKGAYDALQRKCLKTLTFCIYETVVDGPMIEEYEFSFSYSDSDSQKIMMNNIIRKPERTFNSTVDITPNQIVATLVQLMRTLDKMPDERTIVMKLLYYDDDVTQPDYEPTFFRGCIEEVGNVNCKHLVLTSKESVRGSVNGTIHQKITLLLS